MHVLPERTWSKQRYLSKQILKFRPLLISWNTHLFEMVSGESLCYALAKRASTDNILCFDSSSVKLWNQFWKTKEWKPRPAVSGKKTLCVYVDILRVETMFASTTTIKKIPFVYKANVFFPNKPLEWFWFKVNTNHIHSFKCL